MSDAADQEEGVSLDLAGARLKAAFGGCPHRDPHPVETVTGELVAWLCGDCDDRLPAAWKDRDA